MKTLDQLNINEIKCLFTDIDGTITTDGRIGAKAYNALWKLAQKGVAIVPVTGRPAGWCEMIARTWPVHGVIGENGAFYFRSQNKKMLRHFIIDEAHRLNFQQKLKIIESEVLSQIPGAALASDQFCRMFDLAIDFCEDVAPLTSQEIQKIVQVFEKHGATAKVSNIHVNGWFGNYDKLTTCKVYCEKELNQSFESLNENIAFTGDSPNDEPMFEAFKHSFAVKNIEDFKGDLTYFPTYISNSKEGEGFAEIVTSLLSSR